MINGIGPRQGRFARTAGVLAIANVGDACDSGIIEK
jgi:hypothetical protein